MNIVLCMPSAKILRRIISIGFGSIYLYIVCIPGIFLNKTYFCKFNLILLIINSRCCEMFVSVFEVLSFLKNVKFISFW